MDDLVFTHRPAVLDAIMRDSEAIGFRMASEPKTGALLAALASSKPAGAFLEIGTGTGVGAAWLLAGMTPSATLATVDTDAAVVAVARRHLGHDPRIRFHVQDGAEFLSTQTPESFDLVYADAWPGKFSHVDEALALVRLGGIYFIDDLLPQPNWPAGHAEKVPPLVERIEARPDFNTVRLAWASGLLMAVRTTPTRHGRC